MSKSTKENLYANEFDYEPLEYGAMKLDKNLPTMFAKRIAQSVGLLVKDENSRIFYNQLSSFKEFQQLSISSSIEMCIEIVFYGFQLNVEQFEALKLIHKTTKPWMKGHIIGILLERIQDSRISNRDFAESIRTIMEELITKDSSPTEKAGMKRLIIRLTSSMDENEVKRL